MTTRPDPWQPIGTIIYRIALIFVEKTGFRLHESGPMMATEYTPEPEPRWLHCINCDTRTVWELHFWVGDGETDWECVECGAISYG